MKKNHKIIFLLAAWLALFFHPDLHAQTFAVKTNLLSDLTASPELAVETACSRRWSIGLSGNYCGWDPLPEKKFRHWAVRSEGRYWFCEKFNGHFVSLHALGGEYNVAGYGRALSLYPAGRGSRRQGWLAGGGVGYGYQWILGNRWSVEAQLGVSFVHARYDEYECVECGAYLRTVHKNYPALSQAAVSIIYFIK